MLCLELTRAPKNYLLLQADSHQALEDHLSTDCQKELLRKYIAEKEDALNQLKNEVRIREEELINLKLFLLGDVERYAANPFPRPSSQQLLVALCVPGYNAQDMLSAELSRVRCAC